MLNSSDSLGLLLVEHFLSMVSPEDIAKMKADIAVLEKARASLTDAGLRKVLSVWIEDAKKTLAESTLSQR